MPFGFYIIMAAQFFSALADNILLIVAISLLRDMQAPTEYEPLLKTFFTVSYVVLAAFVGAFADSMPKGRVMFISNGIKIVGCAMMFWQVHPLLAYAVVGLGAAAYSPAKYGILTEYLPHRLLVVANGWIEGLTIGAIILGVVVGGLLIRPDVATGLLSFDFPLLDTGVDTVGEMAICFVALFYVVAALFNLYVPDTGVDHRVLHKNPWYLLREFNHCLMLLWRDRLGQISLAVTTLFWGAGATLQFIVIKWAETSLQFDLSKSSMLQGVVAIGVALGAVGAARMITLRRSVRVIPLGIAMGIIVLAMNFVQHTWIAVPLLVLIGALSGFFVVPMNALLQHRGHILMGAGHSIAVQNFNENLSILAMTGLYFLMVRAEMSIYLVITLFGLFLSGTMLLVKFRHEANQRQHDNVIHLDDGGH
ncbi:MAG: Lysophospholipid transporter LplT [Candidatus Accumulibacter regalis]|jgi:LPLT family lysophospholipid transporter-like MFS transporter|uniref:Lysophospholipid transporter LplT n=1 Tax=Accumulibacter regalis TaxID=522306 RepID=A0A011P475_ACCRE|nr:MULTISPECIES: lysophospholipid transporter LplT [unclassified Candidatus Accumulibacter]EXI89753.1 MAG: Lysophospholipid transporter LplT [Candidatus Accumulibacter regalis]MQM33716.1 lysophospholipid transporter LplT [Candidatus Accumulibacter phosphatis]MBL8369136.1 lysophospholipid transporter LplT [Accumulibacter sp.]MBN8513242.1 lysophospholipid transporter LplT [Accumulibacter sp.]HRE70568.1 lysophospholipid transporter LplT [Accumulibacter sp.]